MKIKLKTSKHFKFGYTFQKGTVCIARMVGNKAEIKVDSGVYVYLSKHNFSVVD